MRVVSTHGDFLRAATLQADVDTGGKSGSVHFDALEVEVAGRSVGVGFRPYVFNAGKGELYGVVGCPGACGGCGLVDGNGLNAVVERTFSARPSTV